MTIDQIATIRRLRQSTIEDHIIEIALSDHLFPIDDFIDQSVATEILHSAKQLGQRKLKPIKEQFRTCILFSNSPRVGEVRRKDMNKYRSIGKVFWLFFIQAWPEGDY